MYRIGFGSDIHRLGKGRRLVIGGVDIPSDFGVIGHSDGDALLHSVTDSLLGAMALGDIGSHFPDNDERWKDSDSFVFLSEAVRLSDENGYRIENIDSIISLEKPKIRLYVEEIRRNLAQQLRVDINCISVKAKTGEGLDAVGKSRAIKAEACILIRKI